MKLFYVPGACSLSPHIVLRELGLEFELERVDPKTGLTETGRRYSEINPNGYVPALQLDDGQVLTEGAAIVQHLADSHPDAGLAPPNGTIERARLQETLNFIAAELHKAFSPLFAPDLSDAEREAAAARVDRRMGHLERTLSDGRPYLLGERFSPADSYLFAVSGWTGPTGLDLDRWPNVAAFRARLAQRPSVQSALRAEGLA